MDSPSGIAIEFANVRYHIEENHVLLSDINVAIQQSEIFMLLGSSGSGKTTCLKLINGLLAPTTGKVVVEGRPTQEWDMIRLRRHMGYVIQEVGLFPHYTVLNNVALIPKLEGWEPAKIRARAEELLQLVGLAPAQF